MDCACGACERQFECGWCHRLVGWCEGMADELLDMCDRCAMLFLPLYDFEPPAQEAA